MQWGGGRESSNVEDRRGGGGMIAGGGIGSIVIAILYYLLSGGSPSTQNQDPNAPVAPSGQSQTGQRVDPANDSLGHFVKLVLNETEEIWSQQFKTHGKPYHFPHLVLFTSRINSACGMAGTASGPFYCPEDEKVYIDLAFYQMLRNKLGAPGDFAEAYVIAHEVGHHVQKMLGITDQVTAMQQRASKAQANALSVRLELQADFFAGVWAHYENERGRLTPGDIDEALTAAAAVGDDKLEQQAQGYVVPETFTHGTSAQRSRWFKKGYDTGDMEQGDTFNAQNL